MFDLWILLIIVNMCACKPATMKVNLTNQVESYLMMVQCFKAWILSTIPVICTIVSASEYEHGCT